MKNKASKFLKQVVSVVFTILKAKSMAVKNKTAALKAKLMILSLLRRKKVLMGTITHKLHALMSSDQRAHQQGGRHRDEAYSMAIVARGATEDDRPADNGQGWEFVYCTGDLDEYPDLTHSLFQPEDVKEDGDDDDDGGLADTSEGPESAIDFVRDSHDDESDFNADDEIDRAADIFIRRFRQHMRMQKLDSFKRCQEMLDC